MEAQYMPIFVNNVKPVILNIMCCPFSIVESLSRLSVRLFAREYFEHKVERGNNPSSFADNSRERWRPDNGRASSDTLFGAVRPASVTAPWVSSFQTDVADLSPVLCQSIRL